MDDNLVSNYNYVEIKSDYSNLEEQPNYYIKHTDKALKIIENAHRGIEQFNDKKKKEDLISVLTVQKYFTKTGQMDLE